MDGWVNGWVNEWKNGCVNGWVDRWVGGWMVSQMVYWVNGQKVNESEYGQRIIDESNEKGICMKFVKVGTYENASTLRDVLYKTMKPLEGFVVI